MLSLKDKCTLWPKWIRNKNMLSAVEIAFDGIAQTRKRIMIEWVNEVWREVENTTILLSKEESDTPLVIKEQEKLSEAQTTIKGYKQTVIEQQNNIDQLNAYIDKLKNS